MKAKQWNEGSTLSRRDVAVVESAKMAAAYFPNVFSFVSLFCAMCEDEDRSPFIYAELTTDADGRRLREIQKKI